MVLTTGFIQLALTNVPLQYLERLKSRTFASLHCKSCRAPTTTSGQEISYFISLDHLPFRSWPLAFPVRSPRSSSVCARLPPVCLHHQLPSRDCLVSVWLLIYPHEARFSSAVSRFLSSMMKPKQPFVERVTANRGKVEVLSCSWCGRQRYRSWD
jgi:hypothetical protein